MSFIFVCGWSGSANDNNNVWNVNSNGNFDNNNYDNDNEAGVRPDSFDTTLHNTRNRLCNTDLGNKIFSTCRRKKYSRWKDGLVKKN